jgi:hypothetical protein
VVVIFFSYYGVRNNASSDARGLLSESSHQAAIDESFFLRREGIGGWAGVYIYVGIQRCRTVCFLSLVLVGSVYVLACAPPRVCDVAKLLLSGKPKTSKSKGTTFTNQCSCSPFGGNRRSRSRARNGAP